MQNNQNSSNLKREYYMPLDAYKVFFWSTLGTIIASFLMVFILTGVAMANNISYAELVSKRGILILLSLVSPIVFSSLYFLYNKKNNIKQFSSLGLKNKFKPINILYCLLVSLVCLFFLEPFINILNFGFGKLGYNPSFLVYETDTIGRLFVSILISAVLPAIFEELLFRGIILNGLTKKFDPKTSIILSALLFMLMHGSLEQTFYQFALGLVFGCIAYYSGSVIYSIITHFFNNAIVLTLNYFVSALLEGRSQYNIVDLSIAILYLSLAVLIIYLLIKCISFENDKKEDNFKNENYTYNPSSEVRAKEKVVFYVGLGLSIILWLLNTLAG